MDKSDDGQTRAGDTVPALRRAVQILDLVAGSQTKLSAASITRELGLPKSTAHGLLGVMAELNLLAKAPDGTLRIGAHPLRWTNSFLSQMDIVSVFNEYLDEHRALAAFTVTLTVRDQREVVYIGCRNSDQPLDQTFRIGMRLPAPFTATGKMLLSELPERELEGLLSADFPSPLTSRSVRDLAVLKSELAETRTRGYSVDDGQIREGMVCIGAAIRDHVGHHVAGIAISLLRSEADGETVSRLGETMRAAASDLSRRLGAG